MKIGWAHLLEAGTVTTTSAETLYPAYRLYDRMTARNWKATSTATQTIQVDQGGSGTQAIDTLVIPAGHNLSGCNLQWQHSSNGSAWTDAVTDWTQSGSGIIVKQMIASETKRYWKLEIAGAAAAPYCAEICMTLLYTFPDMLLGATRKTDRVVTRQVSYTGVPHPVKQGVSKKAYSGTLSLESADRTNFEAFLAVWDGYKGFYIEDHDGNQFFSEFTTEPERAYFGSIHDTYNLSIREK